MWYGETESAAAQAARQALAAAITSALARTEILLSAEPQGDSADSATDEAAQLLQQVEGAFVFARQPAPAALVRLMRGQVQAAPAADPARPVKLVEAAQALQRCVTYALDCAQRQREPRAARLIPCWRQIAALGDASEASPAALLSLQLPGEAQSLLLPAPLFSEPLARSFSDLLADAERALLACLRADQAATSGKAMSAFGDAVAAAASQALQDSERACWLALHAYLQEMLAVAAGELPAADKRLLATTLRALRHRHRADLCTVLEPLARDALLALSERTLRTEAGNAIARLFRLDEQLGSPQAGAGDSLQRTDAPAAFAVAVASLIAEFERDPARISEPACWQALSGGAALVRCASALAEPLARLGERSGRMQDERQRELLAALLLELRAWLEDGGACAAALVAVIDLAGDAEAAVAGLALHRHRQAFGARRRLTELCSAMRAELDAAEQPLEAAWPSGDAAQAVQVAADVLYRAAGALALAGLNAESDAATALRLRLVVCRDGDSREVLPSLAKEWVSLGAAVAMLPLRSDERAGDMAPGDSARVACADQARHRLQSIFIDEATGYLRSLRQLASQCAGHELVAARRAAHTLAGCSATIGQSAMASLALALEGTLMAVGWRADNSLLADTLDALERMLADVIETGQCDPQPGLLARLRAGTAGARGDDDRHNADDELGAGIDSGDAVPDEAIEGNAAGEVGSPVIEAIETSRVAVPWLPLVPGDTLPNGRITVQPDAYCDDALSSHELLATFNEEAADLLPQLEMALQAWQQHPGEAEPPRQLLRLLHTLKGSARMAGRHALGDAFHEAEAGIAALAQQPADTVLRALPEWQARIDGWMQGSMPAASAGSADLHVGRADDSPQTAGVAEPLDAAMRSARHSTDDNPALADLQPDRAAGGSPASGTSATSTASSPQLRVSAARLARAADAAAALWVGNAGISDVAQDQRLAVASLSGDIARLRAQLRELEIEAESRIVAQSAPEGDAGFDPLEFDRYTRLHELTRLMAESLADLSGTQRGLARQAERLASAASAQARDLRRFGLDLQAMRSQPLRAVGSRLRHLLRQAAQEAGREVMLVLEGGDVEIDRNVLDQLAGPLGHLLRNAVVHGIEAPARRVTLGKPRAGTVTLGAALAGSELRLWLHDDGQGIDLARVRSRAVALGLPGAADEPDEVALAELIFAPGFSTASEVTALSGRGIGMDAVRAELQALGGRIAVDSVTGQGCRFTLTVPVTLASLPALLATAGTRRIALPAAQIVQVIQPRAGQIDGVAGDRQFAWRECRLAVRHLGEALGERCCLPQADADRLPLVIVEDGERRLALQLDAVYGQRELMLRHPGPQLARVPGLAGATLLGDGSIALILDPFRLPDAPAAVAETAPERPLVLVVDDSLTVRRASQRLLERHGYAVALARDGFEALQQLAERRPAALLLDIEMPRMDGFELLAALRADAGLHSLPVVMITSRIAGRHRERAQQLGVLGYLGKPFDEEALLALLAGLQGGAQLAA